MKAWVAKRTAMNVSPIFQDMRDSGEVRRLEEVEKIAEEKKKKEREGLEGLFNDCLKRIQLVAEKGEFETEIYISYEIHISFEVDIVGLTNLLREEDFHVKTREGYRCVCFQISWR